MGFLDRFKKNDPPTPAQTAPTQPHTAAQQQPAAPTGTAGTAPAASGGIDLTKRAPGLIDLNKKAKISLQKHQLTGVSAAVYLVGDHSGSMRNYYRNGSLQRFTEKTLALALEFDDDGSIPVILFDTVAHKAVDVSVDDYQGAVDRADQAAGRMGTTNYAAAMEAVIAHYRASGATAPALVVFQTDGSPDNRTAAQKALCDASTLPIFWQFVGFGSDRFEFLRKLDELPVPSKRAIDNAGFFEAGSDPDAMSTEALYDNLMSEFPQWLRDARAQGIVRN